MLSARVVAVAPEGSERCEPSGREIVISAIEPKVYWHPSPLLGGYSGVDHQPTGWAPVSFPWPKANGPMNNTLVVSGSCSLVNVTERWSV